MQKRCVVRAVVSASVPKRCGTDFPCAATVQKRFAALAGVSASVPKRCGTDFPLAAKSAACFLHLCRGRGALRAASKTDADDGGALV